MNKFTAKIGALALLLSLATPAFATPYRIQDSVAQTGHASADGEFQLVEDYGDNGGGGANVSIRPREAARIARRAYPGSRVLKVNLLPSGIYAVTLRGEGRLTRVMVDGQSGEIL